MSRPNLEFHPLGLEHESAAADYVAEFEAAGEQRIHGYFDKPEWGHAEFVGKLEAWSRGEELAGWVANTTRFLMDGGRILGNYNFRHELTEELKQHGGHCGYSVRPSERRKGYATMLLGHAKEFGRTLGLTQMLVTCDVENIGSAKTIENNGGVRQDVIFDEEHRCDLARYWITV